MNEIPRRFPRTAEPQADVPTGEEPIGRRSAGAERSPWRLGLIAAVIGAALLLVVGAWMLSGRGSGVVPVVEAPSGPMRVKPDNRGGMQVTGMNDPILSGDFGKGGEALAPPPEAPEPKVLRSQIQAEKPPAKPRPPRPDRLAAARPAASSALSGAEPEPAAWTAAAPPGNRHAGMTAAAGKPTAMPGPAPAPSEHRAVPAGEATVQLAALKSEQAAQIEWDRLVKRMPALLGDRRPTVIRVERDGRVFWRLRTGGFADRAMASEFCAQVKAKGGNCVISSF